MNRTRIVRWLRVLLPLTALVILSTLFLFSNKRSDEADIPYSDAAGDQASPGQRMANLRYSGVTVDGAAITLNANGAAPQSTGGGTANGLRLTWRARDGLAADLVAPDASLDGGQITLRGGVRMTTSSGWILTSPEFNADTAQSRLVAPSQVRANAPFGDLSAGSMILTQGEDSGHHVLNFNGGVHLVYQP